MANPLGINGGSKQRVLADALRRELYAHDKEKLRALVSTVTRLALAGEQWAAQLIFDRIDGRVPQPLVGQDGEGPVKLQIEWKLNGASDLHVVEAEQPRIAEPGVQLIECTPEPQVTEPAEQIAPDQPPV